MLIIDAYNVLHLVGDYGPAAASLTLARLASLISQSRFAQTGVLLVCDGNPPPHWRSDQALPNNISIVFAGPRSDADALIIRAIGDSTAPRRLTVVTNDRQITTAARRRRARVLPSESFLGQLLRDASSASTPDRGDSSRPDGPLDSPEIDRWLAEFGYPRDSRSAARVPEPPAPALGNVPHSGAAPDESARRSTPKLQTQARHLFHTRDQPPRADPDPSLLADLLRAGHQIPAEELDTQYWLDLGYDDPSGRVVRKKPPRPRNPH